MQRIDVYFPSGNPALLTMAGNICVGAFPFYHQSPSSEKLNHIKFDIRYSRTKRRLDEIDAKIFSNIPVLSPSIDEAADLLDDLPELWREALPEERRRLVAPLIERVYLDLKTKKIAGIKPKPGFGELLAHAAKSRANPTAVLMSQNAVQRLPNIGMVETGEGRVFTICKQS